LDNRWPIIVPCLLSLSVGRGLKEFVVDMESSSMAMTLLATLELIVLGSGPVGVDGADETGVVELTSFVNWKSSTSDGCDGRDTSMGEKERGASLTGGAGTSI
jgi:hypothetical protein